MAIRFKCTKCSHSLQVPDEHVGRKAKCPNCGQILPVPAAAQAQPSAKPATPAKPAIPAGPSAIGPIPSLAKRRKPGKAKPKPSSKQTQGAEDQGRPPELRSAKKPVIFGVILAAVLVLVVVGWQMGWFGSKKEPTRPELRPTGRTPPGIRAPVEEKPTITVQMLRERTDRLELQMATLEQLLTVEPATPAVDQDLIGTLKALEEFSREIQGQLLVGRDLSQLLSQNRKWLYEKVLARARGLVGQYRFASAKGLLEQVLPAGAVAPKPDTGPPIPARSPRRVGRSLGGAGWQGAQQDCRGFANGELIRRGLQGELCLWVREDPEGLTVVSLDAPDALQQPRGWGQTQQQWQEKWGPAREHLSFITQLQAQAEAEQYTARAGRLYVTIRDLERRCMTFETPAQADTQLMKRLARQKADYKVYEQLRGMIARCRYGQALQLAQQRIKENPANPDNYHWLLRCYLESYNTKPLEMDSALLLGCAEKMAELSRYDLPNNLLALSLRAFALPEGLGSSTYGDFVRSRTSQLNKLAEYAERYEAVVEWMKGESRDMVLRDFEYSPFLAGEPVELLDRQGVLYTLYGRGGSPGRAALILARVKRAQQEQGLSLHMPNGWRYQLWNVYPPAGSADLDAASAASVSEPIFKPVLDLGQINVSKLPTETTIPVVNSLTVLHCQQDSDQRRGGWSLRISRSAVNAEQLEADSRPTGTPRTSGRPNATRKPAFLGAGRTSSTPRSPARDQGSEADKYIWINFTAGGRGATVDGQDQPITCLVRSRRRKIAYFSDAKGDYVLGLAGKRFYAEKTGLLQTLNEKGPNWCLALDAKAYPPELREKMDEYEQFTAPRPSPGRPSFGPGPGPPGPGPGPRPIGRPRTTPESRSARQGRFTVAEAASWLSDLAAQRSAPLGRRISAARRDRSGSALVVGRWLNWQGTIIAQLDGRIKQLGRDIFAEPMFCTVQAATDLFNSADTSYQASLQAWPTLAGEVYKETNKSRLSRLLGLKDGGSSRFGRTQGLTAIDVDKASLRAEVLLASGDSNQAIAIYTDLIGVLSLRLQQAITQDLLLRPLRGSDRPSGQSQPDLFGGDLNLSVNRRSRGASPGPPRSRGAGPGPPNLSVNRRSRGAGPGPPRSRGAGPGPPRRARRPGRSTSQDSLRLSPQEEQFFADADLLVRACAGRAAALQQVGLAAQARQSLRQGSSRVRGYLLTELTEFIQYRRSRGMPVSAQLRAIRQRWQAMSREKIGAGLSRALQAARGQAISGLSSPEVAATAPTVSTEPSKPPMSLAVWLDSGTVDRSVLEPERLMIAAQFSWIRDSIALDQTESGEPLAPAERAEQIIELAQAYQSSAEASPATAEALWQLGSFMAAMGYQAEAWDCLGQAGAIYSELAQALLSETSDSQSRSEQKQQDHSTYAFRTAALAALTEAAAIAGDDPLWAKCSAPLAAETRAKLLQLRRGWSGVLAGSEEPPAILSSSSHALRIVAELAEARAYGRPRMRFWWWHYPPELSQRQLSVGRRGPTRPGTSPARSRESSRRPKLEYSETQPKTRPGRRSQPRRRGSPQPIDPMLPPTPGSRLGI